MHSSVVNNVVSFMVRSSSTGTTETASHIFGEVVQVHLRDRRILHFSQHRSHSQKAQDPHVATLLTD